MKSKVNPFIQRETEAQPRCLNSHFSIYLWVACPFTYATAGRPHWDIQWATCPCSRKDTSLKVVAFSNSHALYVYTLSEYWTNAQLLINRFFSSVGYFFIVFFMNIKPSFKGYHWIGLLQYLTLKIIPK